MTKNVMQKMRKWDENIGKLIVFAVTIIIAVGVLGTLAYFYNSSRKNAVALSTLTSTSSSSADLKTLWFCKTTATWNYVKYDPISDTYGLVCSGTSAVSVSAVSAVKGVINVKSGDNNDATLSWAGLTFKINK